MCYVVHIKVNNLYLFLQYIEKDEQKPFRQLKWSGADTHQNRIDSTVQHNICEYSRFEFNQFFLNLHARKVDVS